MIPCDSTFITNRLHLNTKFILLFHMYGSVDSVFVEELSV